MFKFNRSTIIAGCCILALSFSQAAIAGPVLDQSDTVNSGSTLAPEIGESFTAGLSGLLSSIFIGSSSAQSTAGADTVSIYRGNGILLGSLINSASLTPTNSATGYTFDVSSLLVNVLAGQQYTFDVTAALGQTLYVNGDGTGSYSRGNIFYAGLPYGYDLDFATYVTPAAAAVPEPATLAILGISLLGLGVTRRRLFA